ncbi:MAG TPA: hypothetical protein VKF38_07995 [Anaerolineaceae bacterium]|nr:hypothetical protein [Anaerolineaceae bacterium]
MEYTVIEVKGRDKFIAEVNRYIQAGWTPVGGIFWIPGGLGPIYIQAMVRNTSKP